MVSKEDSREEEAIARQMMIDVIKVMFNSARWEDRFGAINGTILLIKFNYFKENENLDPTLIDFIWNNVRNEKVPMLMVDQEFRVRNQLGPLLREMFAADNEKAIRHFDTIKDMLLDNIEATFEREPEGGQDASADPLVGKKINVDETGRTMHDTQGWKSLETSMRILQNIIEAMGPSLYNFDL